MTFTIVKRKSVSGKTVYCLYEPNHRIYKQVAMGERAEFPTKEAAKKYRQSLRSITFYVDKEGHKRWMHTSSKGAIWGK